MYDIIVMGGKTMNIMKPKSGNLEKTIQPIDDAIITELAKIAFRCNKDTERYNLRDELYVSKYNPQNLETKEKQLEEFLTQLNNEQVRTENQNKEYKWVKINTENMGAIASRFYIAPNPNTMHEMVRKLVEVFSAQNIPVRFKYQLTTGMKQCDRIIIYSDYSNKSKVEDVIKNIYQKQSYLFDGCERSVAWIYGTNIPGVYCAPETPGDAYSNKLSDAILEAKACFNYLYGITNKNSKINLKSEDAEQAMIYMKLLIASIMLRKGLLLSTNGKGISFKDKDVKSFYDNETGVLKNSNMDERGYYEVQFLPTQAGRKALLENFYSVSVIQPQNGLNTRYLTVEERREEVNRELFKDYYVYKENGTNKSRK